MVKRLGDMNREEIEKCLTCMYQVLEAQIPEDCFFSLFLLRKNSHQVQYVSNASLPNIALILRQSADQIEKQEGQLSGKNPNPPEEDSYLRLIREFPLRPIRNEADFKQAIAVVDRLVDRDPLDSGEEDYLEVLGDLLVRYDNEQAPMPPLPESEMLRYLMEERGINQAEISRNTRIAHSTISEILSGRRAMTRRHIEVLSRYFSVRPGVFLSK